MQRRPSTGIAAVLILILFVVTIIGGFTVLQLPDPVTEQARRTNVLYIATLTISLIVYLGVTSGIIWAMFRFRRQSVDEIPEQIHGSSRLEVIWTVIPIIIL